MLLLLINEKKKEKTIYNNYISISLKIRLDAMILLLYFELLLLFIIIIIIIA